jgi:hypothetical protein
LLRTDDGSGRLGDAALADTYSVLLAQMGEPGFAPPAPPPAPAAEPEKDPTPAPRS